MRMQSTRYLIFDPLSMNTSSNDCSCVIAQLPSTSLTPACTSSWANWMFLLYEQPSACAIIHGSGVRILWLCHLQYQSKPQGTKSRFKSPKIITNLTHMQGETCLCGVPNLTMAHIRSDYKALQFLNRDDIGILENQKVVYANRISAATCVLLWTFADINAGLFIAKYLFENFVLVVSAGMLEHTFRPQFITVVSFAAHWVLTIFVSVLLLIVVIAS